MIYIFIILIYADRAGDFWKHFDVSVIEFIFLPLFVLVSRMIIGAQEKHHFQLNGFRE